MPRNKKTPFNEFIIPPKPQKIERSSWLDRPREGFTKAMEEEAQRMKLSKEGRRSSQGGGAKEFQ
jgi:hypothetical protein